MTLFLVFGLGLTVPAFSMIGKRERDDNGKSEVFDKKTFDKFQKFLKMEEEANKNGAPVIQSTGSLLGDFGFGLFLKKTETKEEKEKKVKEEETLMNVVRKMKLKEKVKREKEKVERIKKEKNRPSKLWDRNRWFWTLGGSFFTILLNYIRGRVVKEGYESLVPVSNSLAYASCVGYPVACLYVWYGKDKLKSLKKYWSDKRELLDTQIKLNTLKFHNGLKQADKSACVKIIDLKKAVEPYKKKFQSVFKNGD